MPWHVAPPVLQVWAPDVVVEVQSAPDAPAQRVNSAVTQGAYFRGSIAGVEGSSAMLAVHQDGRVQGMAFRGNSSWSLGQSGPTPAGADRAAALGLEAEYDWLSVPLTSKKADGIAQSQRRPFTCANSGEGDSFGGLGDTTGDDVPAAARKLLQARRLCGGGHGRPS